MLPGALTKYVISDTIIILEVPYSKFHYFPLDFQLKIVYNFIVCSSRLKQTKKAEMPAKKGGKIQLRVLIFLENKKSTSFYEVFTSKSAKM